MAKELHELAVRAVDAGTVVHPGDDQPAAVRAEGDAADLGRGGDDGQLLAVGQRPHLDRLVRSGGGAAAVLAQGQRAHRGGLLPSCFGRSVGDAPRLHRLVGAGAEQLVALTRVGQAGHRALVPGQAFDLLGRCQVEDTD